MQNQRPQQQAKCECAAASEAVVQVKCYRDSRCRRDVCRDSTRGEVVRNREALPARALPRSAVQPPAFHAGHGCQRPRRCAHAPCATPGLIQQILRRLPPAASPAAQAPRRLPAHSRRCLQREGLPGCGERRFEMSPHESVLIWAWSGLSPASSPSVGDAYAHAQCAECCYE